MRDATAKSERATWTPLRGMIHGAIHGLIVAGILAAITGAFACALPAVALNVIVRTMIAFAIGWILLSVLQDRSGMTSMLVTGLAVLLTLIVLVSHHFILASSGVVLPNTGTGPPMQPGDWLDPAAIGFMNYVPLVGITAVVLLGHDGIPGGSGLIDILTLRVFWGAWG